MLHLVITVRRSPTIIVKTTKAMLRSLMPQSLFRHLRIQKYPSCVQSPLAPVQSEPEYPANGSDQPQDHIHQVNPSCMSHAQGVRALISIFHGQTTTNVYLTKDTKDCNPKQAYHNTLAQMTKRCLPQGNWTILTITPHPT